MSSKESLAELAHPEYWNTRYTNTEEEKYDWLRNFDTIKPFLEKHLPDASTNPRILQLGCGNSTLTSDLTSLSYTNQTSIDFSPPVITQMSLKHPDTTWLVMDVRKMTFPSDNFDIAIDKATLDAMLYGSLWDPEQEVRKNVGSYVDEVARVLVPGGMWLYITWRQPHFIRPLLEREGVWTVESEVLAEPGGGGMFEYYGYVMRKRSGEDERKT
ncbi:hypothetical protein EG328_002664 [Venturia inaequalis]|uniref:Methyltransferase type 11 domain-containing protein n=1 Tax=Venturia inaequalis TaxID=5025 RepID=A0A8H3UVY4_VENIN|nr:hypothetical protein EG328_002664 [Venturia inaequalis]